jgi:hypothetical protein
VAAPASTVDRAALWHLRAALKRYAEHRIDVGCRPRSGLTSADLAEGE